MLINRSPYKHNHVYKAKHAEFILSEGTSCNQSHKISPKAASSSCHETAQTKQVLCLLSFLLPHTFPMKAAESHTPREQGIPTSISSHPEFMNPQLELKFLCCPCISLSWKMDIDKGQMKPGVSKKSWPFIAANSHSCAQIIKSPFLHYPTPCLP